MEAASACFAASVDLPVVKLIGSISFNFPFVISGVVFEVFCRVYKIHKNKAVFSKYFGVFTRYTRIRRNAKETREGTFVLYILGDVFSNYC